MNCLHSCTASTVRLYRMCVFGVCDLLQAAQAEEALRASAAAASAADAEVGRHVAALRDAERKRQAVERKLVSWFSFCSVASTILVSRLC